MIDGGNVERTPRTDIPQELATARAILDKAITVIQGRPNDVKVGGQSSTESGFAYPKDKLVEVGAITQWQQTDPGIFRAANPNDANQEWGMSMARLDGLEPTVNLIRYERGEGNLKAVETIKINYLQLAGKRRFSVLATKPGVDGKDIQCTWTRTEDLQQWMQQLQALMGSVVSALRSETPTMIDGHPITPNDLVKVNDPVIKPYFAPAAVTGLLQQLRSSQQQWSIGLHDADLVSQPTKTADGAEEHFTVRFPADSAAIVRRHIRRLPDGPWTEPPSGMHTLKLSQQIDNSQQQYLVGATLGVDKTTLTWEKATPTASS